MELMHLPWGVGAGSPGSKNRQTAQIPVCLYLITLLSYDSQIHETVIPRLQPRLVPTCASMSMTAVFPAFMVMAAHGIRVIIQAAL